MRKTAVILAGLALLGLATPAAAQHRDHDHGDRSDRGGPGGYGPSQQHEDHGPGMGQQNRGGPQGRPGWQNDSLGAGWGPQQNEVREGVTQRRFIPLGQAIDSIRRRGPGRELDAGLESWNGQPAYRVRWAGPDGRRIDYIVSAETGAIMNVEGGR